MCLTGSSRRKSNLAPTRARLCSLDWGPHQRAARLTRICGFYMSSTHQTLTYHYPQVVNRSIVAIKFDERDQVSDVLTYDIEDGKVVDYIARETPTRGRELGILEQLFGTIGRLPTQLPGQENGPGNQ